MRFTSTCPICQCRFESGDCIHIIGTGTSQDPLVPSFTFDPDLDNLLDCGPNGVAAFFPSWLLDPPAVHVYCSLSQPMPYDTAQILFFNEERYDTDSMHDRVNDPSRLTFNTSGIYLVTLTVRWKKTDNDRGDVAAFIRKNGSQFLAVDSMPVGNEDLFTTHNVCAVGRFDPGDWVEAMAKHDVVRDGEPLEELDITVERFSPIFTATFLRLAPEELLVAS